MRRKEERSKQCQTNNKAKQHSTPKAVTCACLAFYSYRKVGTCSSEDRSTGIDQLCMYVLGGDIYYMYMYSYTCRDIVHVTVLYMYMYNVCSHTCREHCTCTCIICTRFNER